MKKKVNLLLENKIKSIVSLCAAFFVIRDECPLHLEYWVTEQRHVGLT